MSYPRKRALLACDFCRQRYVFCALIKVFWKRGDIDRFRGIGKEGVMEKSQFVGTAMRQRPIAIIKICRLSGLSPNCPWLRLVGLANMIIVWTRQFRQRFPSAWSI